MIKKGVVLYLFVLSCFEGRSQPDTIVMKQNILRCADSMGKSFLQKDWKTFVRYNNPNLVRMLGGEENFIAFTKETLKEIPDTAFKKYEIGKIIQIVQTPFDWQCLVEQKTELNIHGMKMNSTTYLVGESLDGGKGWTFFDSQGDAESARLFKPDLSERFIIPAKVRSVNANEMVPPKKEKSSKKPASKNSNLK